MEALILPGKEDNLGEIRKYVQSAATEAGLEKKASYNLRLAVDEIATNIITHGYKENGLEGNISVKTEIDEKSLTVYIEDTAKPYDPTNPDILEEETLTTKKSLEDRSIGRLGIFLIYESVDRFIYEKLEWGNRNILVVNRTTT